MVEELILSCGVDIVKVSIGTGGLCNTSTVTGVGYPNLSAYLECADAAHQLKGFVIADGGHKEVGDIAKSFCAGSDFVMLGSMLAGASECQGNWHQKWELDSVSFEYNPFSTCSSVRPMNYTQYRELEIYGMSSDTALKKFYGGVDPHRTSEGKTKWVRDKGPIKDIIAHIQGGLRSTGTYIGAHCIKHFPKHAEFIRITR
jgi:GMP reductase